MRGRRAARPSPEPPDSSPLLTLALLTLALLTLALLPPRHDRDDHDELPGKSVES
jgi:hypothetical protein